MNTRILTVIGCTVSFAVMGVSCDNKPQNLASVDTQAKKPVEGNVIQREIANISKNASEFQMSIDSSSAQKLAVELAKSKATIASTLPDVNKAYEVVDRIQDVTARFKAFNQANAAWLAAKASAEKLKDLEQSLVDCKKQTTPLPPFFKKEIDTTEQAVNAHLKKMTDDFVSLSAPPTNQLRGQILALAKLRKFYDQYPGFTVAKTCADKVAERQDELEARLNAECTKLWMDYQRFLRNNPSPAKEQRQQALAALIEIAQQPNEGLNLDGKWYISAMAELKK